MSVEFRTLSIDKCPYCGCTTVVKEEIELAGSGEFNENSKGRKEHRWFKCGCHAYTSYEHIMPENIWEWQTKTNSSRCSRIVASKDKVIEFLKNNNIHKEVSNAILSAINSIDLSRVDRRGDF